MSLGRQILDRISGDQPFLYPKVNETSFISLGQSSFSGRCFKNGRSHSEKTLRLLVGDDDWRSSLGPVGGMMGVALRLACKSPVTGFIVPADHL